MTTLCKLMASDLQLRSITRLYLVRAVQER